MNKQMREIFLSVGELGWALYLSAHLRWKKQQGKLVDAVMCLPGQDCLYENLVDQIFHAHWGYKESQLLKEQDCFGFYGLPDFKLRTYFNARVPDGYQLSEEQPLTGFSWKDIFKDEMIFKPYPYKDESLGNLSETIGMKEILVFPRYRDATPFNIKNLPKAFYTSLVSRLCREFPDYTIRTMGTKEGAHNITYELDELGVEKPNYINHIGKTPTIQALIDRCQVAIGAVGSQSAPTKITLLQGVPSYIIGHTRKRHQEEENWGKTRCGFWEIGFEDYNDFYDEKCIDAIVEFFRGKK